MSRLLYSIGLYLLLPAILGRLAWRGRAQPQYRRYVGERFGSYPRAVLSPVLWFHAVSVGETHAAEPLVAALQQRLPEARILMTHMTPTGRETSERLFGEGVARCYLPYDYPFAVRRFLDRYSPRLGVIMETELWPNLFAACARRGIPLVLANARLSERSARGYRRVETLAREALGALTVACAQSADDGDRLGALGAKRVEITGNLKFDIEPPMGQLAAGQGLRRTIGDRPVLLLASTREGEERLILDALPAATLPGRTICVLVPRHPQRFDGVARLLEERGVRFQRRSAAREIDPGTEVLLGDTMGEMFAYYAAADVAFVGGSLLAHGGQNLIEACSVGAPVLIGPHTFNFAQAAEQAVNHGAARRVADARDLLRTAAELLPDAPARDRMRIAGTEFAAAHRGATQRTLAAIAPLLEPESARCALTPAAR